MRLVFLLLLAACQPNDDGPPPDTDADADADTDADTDTDTDTDTDADTDTDTDTDTGPDTDTDTGPDTDTDTGPAPLELGDACEPGVSDCGENLCCTPCCEADATPECMAPDDAGACPLPDLVMDAASLSATLDVQDVPFSADDCAIEEGCVDGPGLRRLLRFTTTTPNVGSADVYFGDVSDEVGFEYSECHDHDHFSAYADYRLLDAGGAVAAEGHKQAFCLMDTDNWGSPAPARYTCDFQGITAGWADSYGAWLDCQWIDVTDVPPGEYTLEIALNPDLLIAEQDYGNNVATVPVTLVAHADLPPVTDACATLGYGEHRDCEWALAGTFACTPGATVSLTCDPTCTGDCVGDPILRVCEGAETACVGADALAASDRDACGSWCPGASFTCPEGGVVTGLVGAWESGEAASCTLTLVE